MREMMPALKSTPVSHSHAFLPSAFRPRNVRKEVEDVSRDAMTTMPAWSLSGISINAPIQRKCSCGGQSKTEEECEQCKEKKVLQKKSANRTGSSVIPSVVNEVLQSPGMPLDSSVRSFMEAGFGAHIKTSPTAFPTLQQSGISQPSDSAEVEAEHVASQVLRYPGAASAKNDRGAFSNVRVHVDSKAGKSAEAIDAHAYTVGNHIVFAPGKYAPLTLPGQRLLAHELTHVLQQQGRSNAISRFKVEDCDADNPMETSDSVKKAHAAAIDMLQNAIAAVNAAPTPAVIQAAANHFKITLPATTDKDKKNWARAKTALSTMTRADTDATYECEPKQNWWNGACTSGTDAVSIFNIHLCPLWWKNYATPLDRGAILLHEWGHKWGKGVNRVFETYRYEKKYQTMSAEKRLALPDSYMAFAYELKTGSPPTYF